VILHTSKQGMRFWKGLGFHTEPISDHMFLLWATLHEPEVLESLIPTLVVKRTPRWIGWVDISRRPTPPHFGTDQQADFAVVANVVDEKEVADDKEDDIHPEEGKRQPAQRIGRTWWKTLMVGDELTPKQLKKYQSVQRMFLDDVCVPGHAPTPERESQVFCTHHTQAHELTHFNNGPKLAAVASRRCLEKRSERSLSNSETCVARRRAAVQHHTRT
jgi:hypothetical protein